MSAKNKAILQAAIEMFNQKRLGQIFNIYARECQGVFPSGSFKGWDGVVSFFNIFNTAFPDFHVDVTSVFAQDQIFTHYIFTGTNTGTLAGFPATGRTVRVPGLVVSWIEGDRIVKQAFIWDNLVPWRQITGNAMPSKATLVG